MPPDLAVRALRKPSAMRWLIIVTSALIEIAAKGPPNGLFQNGDLVLVHRWCECVVPRRLRYAPYW